MGFVFSTKYRKPVLKGDIAIEVRDMISKICRANEIEIVKGQVSRIASICCSTCLRISLRAA